MQVFNTDFPESDPVSGQAVALGGHPLNKKDPAGKRPAGAGGCSHKTRLRIWGGGHYPLEYR